MRAQFLAASLAFVPVGPNEIAQRTVNRFANLLCRLEEIKRWFNMGLVSGVFNLTLLRFGFNQTKQKSVEQTLPRTCPVGVN